MKKSFELAGKVAHLEMSSADCMIHMPHRAGFREAINVVPVGTQNSTGKVGRERTWLEQTAVMLDCLVIHSTGNGVLS